MLTVSVSVDVNKQSCTGILMNWYVNTWWKGVIVNRVHVNHRSKNERQN